MTTAATPEKKQFNMKTLTYGDMTWIDIVDPTEAATTYLGEHYHFNPLDLDDCLSPRQISKMESYPDYLFIIFHLPIYDKASRLSMRKQWSVFLGKNYIITLHPGDFSTLETMFRQFELNEETRQESMKHGGGYLLYRIMDRTIDAYFPVLNTILNLMEGIEDNVFNDEVEAGKEISILRRDIITQRRIMFPTRALFTELEKRVGRFATIDMTPFFSDLMDHMNKIADNLDEFSEVIEVYKDADYILSGYRANRVIRTLAVLATIALPFLIFTGVWGMRVVLPGGIEHGSLTTFYVILGVCLAAVGGTLLFLKRKKIL